MYFFEKESTNVNKNSNIQLINYQNMIMNLLK